MIKTNLQFCINLIHVHNKEGYILEADLNYQIELHNKLQTYLHNIYSLARK